MNVNFNFIPLRSGVDKRTLRLLYFVSNFIQDGKS